MYASHIFTLPQLLHGSPFLCVAVTEGDEKSLQLGNSHSSETMPRRKGEPVQLAVGCLEYSVNTCTEDFSSSVTTTLAAPRGRGSHVSNRPIGPRKFLTVGKGY